MGPLFPRDGLEIVGGDAARGMLILAGSEVGRKGVALHEELPMPVRAGPAPGKPLPRADIRLPGSVLESSRRSR
jgi:hypothetical protein